MIYTVCFLQTFSICVCNSSYIIKFICGTNYWSSGGLCCFVCFVLLSCPQEQQDQSKGILSSPPCINMIPVGEKHLFPRHDLSWSCTLLKHTFRSPLIIYVIKTHSYISVQSKGELNLELSPNHMMWCKMWAFHLCTGGSSWPLRGPKSIIQHSHARHLAGCLSGSVNQETMVPALMGTSGGRA